MGGLHPVVIKIAEEISSMKLNAWLLDDGELGGKKQALQEAVDILIHEGPSRGLYLSSTKSKVWCHQKQTTDEDPLERNIPLNSDEGMKLLGAPVGSTSFEDKVLMSKIDEMEQRMDKLGV